MYNQFFGLREDPFTLTPDPRFLFMNWKQKRALAGLSYALMSRKRCILLTGEVGMGKTTLVAAALQALPEDRIQFSVINNPSLTSDETLEAILLGFRLTGIPASKPQRLALLEHFVEQWKARGRISAVVIDEAQKLPVEGLEQIRLLGNLESLQFILVGQTELNQIISRKEVQAFKQRIALRLTIERLSAEEVEQYILHRWTKAGGPPPAAFDAEAIQAVVRYSAGTPRLINVLCDNALLLAYGEQASKVTSKQVLDAARILELPELAGRAQPGEDMTDSEPEAAPRRKVASFG